MQAIERVLFSNDWITLLLLLLFFFLFLLKLIDSTRLKNVLFTLFKVSFLEFQEDENYRIFDFFQFLFYLFSIIVISMILNDFKGYYLSDSTPNFKNFYQIFFSLSFYLLIKKGLENLLSFVLLLKRKLQFFLISKTNYLFAISFYLYLAILLKQYAQLNQVVIFYFAVLLFFSRFIFHFLNNKNLILSQLFYFILYICAFEIAPLLILFKLMF